MNITKDIKYIGVNDHQIDLFEGQYKVPNGMSYNSYIIMDEKIAVFDTVDKNFKEEWLDKEKLKEKLPYKIDSIIENGVVKHSFSHVIWNMQIYLVKLKEKTSDYLFVSESEIESTYSLPTAYKKVFTKLLK